jgi:hypothetical protein
MAKIPELVIWLDPGLKTGVATLLHGKHFDSGEGILPEIGELLEDYGAVYRGRMALGWEQYVLTSGGGRTGSAGPPIEVIGVARWIGYKMECTMLQPVPSAMRKVATPEMLDRLGWWCPGLGHANDAARHMLSWLMRSKLLTPEQHAIVFPEKHCQTPVPE